ncbi:hypothetical protein KKH27_05230 [bacterium]|nr:hypothetical protein [bacterium]MBU1985226.1 hypothetical protein [bacterium]
MRTLVTLCTLILILTSPLLAERKPVEHETLLGSHEIRHGGYGGLSVKFTGINDEFDVLVGGQGGWIINHMIIFGVGV